MESTYSSWSQSGFYQESIRSLSGVHQEYQDFIRTPDGVHQESIRSLSGVHQEYQDFIRTPDGLHQDSWGSVTYRSGSSWVASCNVCICLLQILESNVRIKEIHYIWATNLWYGTCLLVVTVNDSRLGFWECIHMRILDFLQLELWARYKSIWGGFYT